MGTFFSSVPAGVFKPTQATANNVSQVQGTSIANTLGNVLQSIATQNKTNADTDKLIQDMTFDQYKLPLQLADASLKNQEAQENLNILKTYGMSMAEAGFNQALANIKNTKANTANTWQDVKAKELTHQINVKKALSDEYTDALSNYLKNNLKNISNPSQQNIMDILTLGGEQLSKDKRFNGLSEFNRLGAFNSVLDTFTKNNNVPDSANSFLGGISNKDNLPSNTQTKTDVDKALNKVNTNTSSTKVSGTVSQIPEQGNVNINTSIQDQDSISNKDYRKVIQIFDKSDIGKDVQNFLHNRSDLSRSQKDTIYKEARDTAIEYEQGLRQIYDEYTNNPDGRIELAKNGITDYAQFVDKSGYPSTKQVMADTLNEAVKNAMVSSNRPIVKVQAINNGLASADSISDAELDDLDNKTLYDLQSTFNIFQANNSMSAEQQVLANRIKSIIAKRDKEVINPALAAGVRQLINDGQITIDNPATAISVSNEQIRQKEKVLADMDSNRDSFSDTITKIVDMYASKYSNITNNDKAILNDILSSTENDFMSKMKKYGLSKEQQNEMIALRKEVIENDTKARAKDVGENIAHIKAIEKQLIDEKSIEEKDKIKWSEIGQLTNSKKNDFRYGMLIFQTMSKTEVDTILKLGGKNGYEFIKELLKCNTRNDLKSVLVSYQDTINGALGSTYSMDFKTKALAIADGFKEMLKENPNNIGYFVSGSSNNVSYTPLSSKDGVSPMSLYGTNVLRMDPSTYSSLNQKVRSKLEKEIEVLRKYNMIMKQVGTAKPIQLYNTFSTVNSIPTYGPSPYGFGPDGLKPYLNSYAYGVMKDN